MKFETTLIYFLMVVCATFAVVVAVQLLCLSVIRY